jgi:hypothetical protein
MFVREGSLSVCRRLLSSGPTRVYHYHIDVHGRLYLSETKPKNIATCLRDGKFLNFFFKQLRTARPEDLQWVAMSPPEPASQDSPEILKERFKYVSPCGKEMNFVECADVPIVFQELEKSSDGNYNFTYASSLTVPFHPDKLRFSLKTKRLYHPLDEKLVKILGTSHGLVRSSLAMNLSRSFSFAEHGGVEFSFEGKQYLIEEEH